MHAVDGDFFALRRLLKHLPDQHRNPFDLRNPAAAEPPVASEQPLDHAQFYLSNESLSFIFAPGPHVCDVRASLSNSFIFLTSRISMSAIWHDLQIILQVFWLLIHIFTGRMPDYFSINHQNNQSSSVTLREAA